VTGHGDEKIAVEMMKMGARDYIVKSTGLREILPHILSRVRCDLEREKKLNLTESTLQLERHRMINILDTMADGVYIENERHEIEYANPSLQLAFGNFSRKKCSDYFLEDTESLCSWCGKNDHGEYETSRLEWHSARNEKTYDLLTTPLSNPDGSFSVMGIFRDITDFKTARAEIDSRVKELEEFYEMAEGRELKMKELKEEVDRLRVEINNLKNKAQI
jgi:PAS domain-containing protein